MTMRWSYLASLGRDGALDWGGDATSGIPASGHILPDLEDTKVYLRIRQLARAGLHEGRDVDWGACAIKVNGPELMQILTDCYDTLGDAKPDSLLGRYVAYARSLGAGKYIAFLSVEL